MKYETLTLDQFDEKLRNSGFKATEKEIETIQDRVRTKMLTGTVKRAIQSLLDSARILPEDMDQVKQITATVQRLTEIVKLSNQQNVLPKGQRGQIFHDYHVKTSDRHQKHTDKFLDEAA
ncbi:hypothetical protein LM010_10060 [Lacticaseibacillus manihotivorans]|uniref:Uncharacterized protein n=3 Tax=Lacticaseibacillus manihotivorans TaxID=88233 RepID=A0A5P8JSS3_9LACO|nr:hypothetical protein [Lacticaseibacillus manihotivorans]QFQ91749.1 hypothetical protein LM010_10060 [Lacticaseibacillus manihotivorans]